MDKNKIPAVAEHFHGNPYPGRGIVVGKSEDGKKALFAYFIMGRSENSRNRVFELRDGALFTRAFDESKVTDPSLIIYPAMRKSKDRIVVTNGDQTETVIGALAAGDDFFTALEQRTYEPDAPNYTPRISAMLTLAGGDFTYDMSILRRRTDGSCERAMFSYLPQAGIGHTIHTYVTDGNPLPSFAGAPAEVRLMGDLDKIASSLWDALDQDNRISLFVAAKDLATGKEEYRLFNKHTRSEK